MKKLLIGLAVLCSSSVFAETIVCKSELTTLNFDTKISPKLGAYTNTKQLDEQKQEFKDGELKSFSFEVPKMPDYAIKITVKYTKDFGILTTSTLQKGEGAQAKVLGVGVYKDSRHNNNIRTANEDEIATTELSQAMVRHNISGNMAKAIEAGHVPSGLPFSIRNSCEIKIQP